ncbi:1,4-dihydroxy-2-naphthoate polyprenyltransferase [Microbacterium sp. SORGH_AS_0888]|uniref:1,4-dihydroxy-2-naphthoate polyprenyltransferase n=1 Tax=Microbacterium sp. SORGH_AS_0888 TaxID=3041791 RepID=UPI0027892019|nr:1,4-dihydroxy-2-naphthoate octaprenyltransferase [Microbacterium sp. SORGH_AS_0888]
MASRTRKHSSTRHRSGNPQKRHAAPDPRTQRRLGVGDWIGAARLRTLPLAVTPVLIGTGAAHLADVRFHWVLALGCLAVAVLLQIGVNFANDYSDGVRGTDAYRVGPARLVGSGRARPRTVLITALVFFGLSALVGLALVIRTQLWWMVLVGAAAVAAAWFYTGGRRPYGYSGLGELFVFVFFGLVATVGTTWIQSGVPFSALPQEAWFGAIAAGLLACAVLLANNLRDIVPDKAAGKRTLSVRIGKRGTQALFTVFVLVPFVIAAFLALFYPIAWLTMLALLGAGPAILIVWTYREPRELVVALSVTSLTSLAYGALLAWAFVG